MDDRLNSFCLTSDNPGVPDKLPIYDIFHCRDRHIGMVGPYYTRAAMGQVEVLIEDQRAPLKILPDSRQFTCSVLAEIPRAILPRWNAGLRAKVTVRHKGRTRFTGVFSRFVKGSSGRLAVATLAKYDAPYMKEWVDHHAALGVEHFYIYNNDAPDIKESLRDYTPGMITHIDWPYPYGMDAADLEPFWPATSHHYTQPPQQMHAILKYGDCWDWMGMLDADEFVVPMTDEPLVDTLDRAALGEWCERPHIHCAGVEMQGKWFGTSGHDKTQTPVRSNYRQCEKGHTAATKWFVRPQYIDSAVVHYFETTGQPARVPTNILRYNHYRAISQHKRRYQAADHDHYSNETTDRATLV